MSDKAREEGGRTAFDKAFDRYNEKFLDLFTKVAKAESDAGHAKSNAEKSASELQDLVKAGTLTASNLKELAKGTELRDALLKQVIEDLRKDAQKDFQLMSMPQQKLIRIGEIAICWGRTDLLKPTDNPERQRRAFGFEFPSPGFAEPPAVSITGRTNAVNYSFAVANLTVSPTGMNGSLYETLNRPGDWDVYCDYVAIGKWSSK